MLGGVSTDFNLMLRRGEWGGSLQVLRDALPPAEGAAAGLCMVLQGTWRYEDSDGRPARMLAAGQGLWWVNEGGEAAPSITPVRRAEGAMSPTMHRCWPGWPCTGAPHHNLNQTGCKR